jgi:hypothetical protein
MIYLQTRLGEASMTQTTILDKISEQSAWYGQKARKNRSTFFGFKIVQIVMAAAIPVVSVYQPPAARADIQRWINALLGAAIGIIEAVLQLGQYQQNWLLYRATREALRREDFLHSAKAGPYAGQADPDALYVVRADAVMSGETSKWLVSQQQQISAKKPNA